MKFSKLSMMAVAALILTWALVGNGDQNQNSGPVSASDQQSQATDQATKRGKQHVDEFTGAFGYSIPIDCAPARHGSEPNLVLTYASAGGNGWCGYGWNLSIGSIERNTKDGFPITYAGPTAPVAYSGAASYLGQASSPQNSYDDSKGFMLNLFGKEYKMLPTGTANEYRPEVDTDFVRGVCDPTNDKWLVYDKSGTVYTFGLTTASRVANTKAGWGGNTAFAATFQWGLEQIDTALGDRTTVSYTTYTSPEGNAEKTIYPVQITYNSYGSTFTDQYTIVFTTETTVSRPDRRIAHNWGFRTEQNRRLTEIICSAGGQRVSRYTLAYTTSPATRRSLLHTVTYYGKTDTAPQVQNFTYQANPNAVSFSAPFAWSGVVQTTPGSTSGSYEPFLTQVNTYSGGFSYSVADLMDIDGDGLPDRVNYDGSHTSAARDVYQVQRNQWGGGTTSFGSRYTFGNTSTGSGNASDASPFPDGSGYAQLNTPYGRIRDLNGDGLPDRVMDYWKPFDISINPNLYGYTNFTVALNNGTGFNTPANWAVTNVVNKNDMYANGACYTYQSVEGGGSVNYGTGFTISVGVGLFDINGDGLPDRVMTTFPVYEGMTNLYVQFNTGSGFTPMRRFPYRSQNWNGSTTTTGQNYQSLSLFCGIETPDAHMMDMDGDGLPDHLMWLVDHNQFNGESLHPASYFCVEYGNGYSFEAVDTSTTTVPGAYDRLPGVVTQTGNNTQFFSQQYGNRLFLSDAMWDLPFTGLYDVNGDGLPDRVVVNKSSIYATSTSAQWLVYLNNGMGFDTTPTNVTVDCQSHNTGSDYDWWSMNGYSSLSSSPLTTLIDINGDGLLDRVMSDYNNIHNIENGLAPSSQNFIVQTNMGPYPDLLTNVDNGQGGTIAVAYKSSSLCDNRLNPSVANSGSCLPFPRQVVTSVTESDGVNPGRKTTYDYAGGFYDGARREFGGFAIVTNTDPSLRKTISYFHQGGGRDYSSVGEYQDVVSGVSKFAKRDMPYRIEAYGTDSKLYKMTINQVDQVDLGNARFFPFVSQSFDYDYDYTSGGTQVAKTNGTKFVYGTPFTSDPKTYVLTNEVLWGEVVGVSLTSIAAPTDVDPTDTRYHQTAYATISGNANIKDHPAAVRLTADYAGASIIQETKYSYNADGTTAQVQKRICPSGSYETTTYNSYDGYGNANLITDPVGIQTAIVFDSHHTYPATTTLQVATGPVSYTTTTTYDLASGSVLQQTDPMGVMVQNTYDQFCRLTETDKTPVGGSSVWVKKMQYALNGVNASTHVSGNYTHVQMNDGVDAVNGFESRTYFDGFGRIIQTVSEAEQAGWYRRVSTAYNQRGEVFLTTWPVLDQSGFTHVPPSGGGIAASFTDFDAPGRVNKTRARVNATFTSGAYPTWALPTDDTGSPLDYKQWSYLNGSDTWWKIFTDEDGKVRNYQYDAFGQNVKIQEMNGASVYATTTLKYDLAGNLTNIVNQNSENIYFGYDDVGNKVAMADPHLGVWTYGRDAAGRVVSQVDGRGNLITNVYTSSSRQDPLGRVQTKMVFKSIADYPSHPDTTTTYTYDTSDDGNYVVYKGLLYKTVDSMGWEKNGYDSRGRLIKTTRHLNINNQDYTTTYAYNDGDKVISTGYPNSGPTIQYEYQPSGALKHVYQSAPVSHDFYTANTGTGNANFDEFGHLLQWTYGNGVVNNRSYYSTSKRLQTISAGSGGSLMSKTYEYSKADDITKITGTGLSSSVAVTYDNVHRVTAYGSTSAYTYDEVGNIKTDSEPGGTPPAYGYGNARKQAVKSAQGMAYLYDKCGNMIVRHGGTTGSQALEYDSENRLMRFSQAGAILVEYGYADDGARLWKRTDQDPNQLQVWIGKFYEEKTDATGKHILYHVYASDQLICTYEDDQHSLIVGGTDSSKVGYYYHEDNINSSSVLTDGNGAQKEINLYYPFGRAQTASPVLQASFQVSRRFTGQILDAETGLYYYNFRYYDPEIGRFIQADDRIPDLSNPQSYNRYSYCINNPLRYTDPDGHGYWSDVGGMFAGYYDAGAGLVTGTAHAIAHPIAAAEGLATAVAHPINTGRAIASSVAQDWNSGARGQGKVVGNIILAVASAVAPEAQAGNLSKAEQVANVGQKIEQAGLKTEQIATDTVGEADGSVKFQRWKRGDAIDKPLPDGSSPSWDVARSRYWKNRYEASKNSGEFSQANLERMRRGVAPQDYNSATGEWESRELHHVDPQRNGGANSPLNLREVTPDQHRKLDPYRK